MEMLYELSVEVMPKPGIADPEGATIERALRALGFATTRRVSAGKVFKLQLEASTENEALEVAGNMAGKLLANPVIEVANVSSVRELQVPRVTI